MIDLYCERVEPGLWAEPFNALSNLAFFVAAYVTWRLARRVRLLDAPVWWLIALIVAIGGGSMLFHSLATPWAMAADVLPILLFQLSYLWIYTDLVLRRGRLTQAAAVAVLIALLLATLPLAGYANGSLLYLPALLALLVLGSHHALHAHTGRPLLLAATAVFTLSLAARTVDQTVCSDIPIGTHYLWHLFNGVVLYLVMRGLLLERATPQGRNAPMAC
jgi:hypothetical protein